MSTRLLAPAAVLAASICTTTQVAVAAVEPVPNEPPVELVAGQGCAFPLRLAGVDGKRHKKTFTDKNGETVRVITAGKGEVLTYTNLATQKSVTIKTGGSVQRTVTNPDGTLTVSATGGNGLVLFPTDVPSGPTTTQYTGRIVYTVDPATGVFTLLSTSGRQRDICAELS